MAKPAGKSPSAARTARILKVLSGRTNTGMTAGEIADAAGIPATRIAVSEMDRVTQQNAALVEESAAATGALMQQTSRLTQVVSLFRTERSTAGA